MFQKTINVPYALKNLKQLSICLFIAKLFIIFGKINLGIINAGELNGNTFTNIQDDKKTIMFGCVRNDNIMCLKNKLILFAKYYIYM